MTDDYCPTWESLGKPKIRKPEVKTAAELAEQVYEFSAVGGGLHCQLDDDNLEDLFFEDADLLDLVKRSKERNYCLGQLQAEVECFLAFKALTLEERFSALALKEGRWSYAT